MRSIYSLIVIGQIEFLCLVNVPLSRLHLMRGPELCFEMPKYADDLGFLLPVAYGILQGTDVFNIASFITYTSYAS